mgnify:CR=1 FL=1
MNMAASTSTASSGAGGAGVETEVRVPDADPDAFHGSRWAGQAAAIASPRGDGEAVAAWLVADAERVLGELL